MYTEEFWAKTHQIWENAFNKGELDGLDDLIAPGYVRHMPPFPDIVGLAGIKDYIEYTRTNYSDCRLTFGNYISHDGKIAMEWTFEGTRSPVSPTTGEPRPAKRVSFTGCNVEQYEDGKLVVTRVYGDWLGFLQQLDMVPRFG